jgi:MFS family permease
VEGLDEALIATAVADCISSRIDSAAYGSFRDNPSIPDSVEDFVFADDAVAVLHEEDQQVEHLWFDMHDFTLASQFVSTKVQLVVIKSKHRDFLPGSLRDTTIAQLSSMLPSKEKRDSPRSLKVPSKHRACVPFKVGSYTLSRKVTEDKTMRHLVGRCCVPRKWLILAAATVAMAGGFGMMTTVASFIQPLELEFGWRRGDISVAYSMTTIGAAAGGLLWGFIADRLDTRPITLFGGVVLAGGLLLLSQQSDLATIQSIYLVMGALGFACLYTPVLTTVGAWFGQQRGLATGIVTAGGTLGQGITPPVLQYLMQNMDWRDACIVLGLFYLLALTPLMGLITKPPPAMGGTAGEGRRWRISPLLSIPLLSAAAVLCCVCMAVPLVHLLPYLVDQGRSPSSAAGLLLVMMLAGSVGRIAFGFVTDRLGGLMCYAAASLAQTLTVYWFVSFDTLPSLYTLAIVFGFGFSGVMTSLILCVREAAPTHSVGFATALVGVAGWIGMGGGGFLGGYCFDVTQAYEASFAAAAVAGVCNILVVLVIGFASLPVIRFKGDSKTGGETMGQAVSWMRLSAS